MNRELLQQALDALKLHLTHHEHGCVYLNPVMYALEAALAQLEQEPVAHMYPSTLKDFEHGEKADYAYSIEMGNMKTGETTVPLYTLGRLK